MEASCDWQQFSPVLDRDLSVYLGKGGPERAWSLTSRLHETNHGKSARHVIAEDAGAGAGHLGAQQETHLNHADLHKASREAACCAMPGYQSKGSLRALDAWSDLIVACHRMVRPTFVPQHLVDHDAWPSSKSIVHFNDLGARHDKQQL